MAMGSTLALHLGALGDFVLSWPALGRLAALGPLHLWGRGEWGRLILLPERVHEREAARFASLFASEMEPSLQSWLGGFDRALVFAAAPDAVLLANLASAVPQVETVATRPPRGRYPQVAAWQVEQLERLGLGGPGRPLPPRLEAPVRSSGAMLAPGSGGKAKRLAPELCAVLARRLHQGRGSLTLVLGPAEEPAYRDQLAQALGGVPHQILADPPIADLARRIMGASLFLGADSGVTHLAASLGAPTLAVFQASDPRLWSPQGPRARVLGALEAPYVDLTPPDAGLC
ncbi:MAG: glycosyltransferase family 9 protein [Proteobacteria bacterium]|nr:glycosyltransferase family 9 protein [Pseudomonadota bacterium]MBU1450587.1 glycosyltransferase family 9 protein [Pseudomonadota bacterium]MBU2469166.1 glycosyltransferase family 9 protein [Pseudomonadota bacterium]MBU2516902.1 glycosyltransferase family 9 protein [Pseudomonadota bacterium]